MVYAVWCVRVGTGDGVQPLPQHQYVRGGDEVLGLETVLHGGHPFRLGGISIPSEAETGLKRI